MKHRLQSWPERLELFYRERRDTPFAWGSNDCLHYACDGILAMTGEDILAEYRGGWTDEAGARAFLAEVGSFDAFFDARLTRVMPAYAQRGDVGLVPSASEDLPTVALCLGSHWCGPHQDGIVVVPFIVDGKPWATRCWATGR